VTLLLFLLAADARTWLFQAQQYCAQQNWAQCESAAREALRLNSRSADAEVLLGYADVARSRLPSAEEHLQRALALQPRHTRAWSYLGSLYLQEKRLPDAARAFAEVLRAEPDNSSVHYNLGLIALLQEKPAEAAPHFEAVCRKTPSDAAAWTGLLESQLLLGRNAAARVSARKLQALLSPRDPQYFRLATLLAMHGEYGAAIPLLEALRAVSPQVYDVEYNLALAYSRAGQPARAEAILRPLAERSGRAEAYNLLGLVEEQVSRPKEALAAYHAAVSLDPANEDYRFDLGNALLQNDQPEESLAVFTEGVRDFPESWRMRLGQGAARYVIGDYEQAAQALLEAVRREPRAQLAYFLLGKTYESAAPLQPAILAAFRTYLARDPKDAWAYYHYGVMLYLQAQAERRETFTEAEQALRKALALDPNLSDAYLQLGILAQAQGRYEASIPLLERAARAAPNLAAVHYRLAQAYQRTGQAGKAAPELRLFQSLRTEAPSRQERAQSVRALPRKP
jgi:tetratricopeptide (TPR) repeat protein